MSNITAVLDLSEVSGQVFDPTLKLRAAVVYDGTVLGSTLLAPQTVQEQLPFSIAFAAPYLPGASRPCLVRLIIGPHVSDTDLLNLTTLSVAVTLAPRDPSQSDATQDVPAQADDFNIALGILHLTRLLYDSFTLACATYTILGRVVCRNSHYDRATRRYVVQDDPVPGAMVEAYDVTNVFASFHHNLTGSVVTDVNGYFKLTFTKCCFTVRPWPRGYWVFDPDVFDLIRNAFRRAGLADPQVPVGPEPDPLYFQQLVNDIDGGLSAIMEADTSTMAAPWAAESLRRQLPRALELESLKIWPFSESDGCAPNIKFRVTQMCGNELREIRSETNFQIRHDIPHALEVTLLANEQACCLSAQTEPECPGCTTVMEVGCVPTHLIGGADAPQPALRGYARIDERKDRFFHGSLDIKGLMDIDVDYFKVQFRTVSEATAPGAPWADLPAPAFRGTSNPIYGTMLMPADFAPTLKAGQTVIITRQHYEELHPELPRVDGEVSWANGHSFFRLDTNAGPTPDGLYEFRFVGYGADSADNLILESERVLTACDGQRDETFFLRIDNRVMIHSIAGHPCGTLSGGIIHACTDEPECYIREIWINEERDTRRRIDDCGVASLTANDSVTIHFTVTVPPTGADGHLDGYTLFAQYGAAAPRNLIAGGAFQPDPTFEVGPSYQLALDQGAIRPHWYGGDYKITVPGSFFPQSCAYILRLNAWKRNACSGVHRNQFARSITLVRTDITAL